MKFTTSTLTIILASISGSNAVLSPYVTCCEDNNGKYEIINGKDGQYGVCKKSKMRTDAKKFYKDNCDTPPPPPPPLYHVYALNNCDTKVGADFELHTKEKGTYDKTVFIKKDHCKNIGETDEETVSYTEFGSFVADGKSSCENIIKGGNPECTKGIDSHSGKGLKLEGACVIKLC
jgi:hypothetical protein